MRQQMPCSTAVMLDERTVVFNWLDYLAGFNERKRIRRMLGRVGGEVRVR
jgi:hypothetical protein